MVGEGARSGTMLSWTTAAILVKDSDGKASSAFSISLPALGETGFVNDEEVLLLSQRPNPVTQLVVLQKACAEPLG